MESQSNAINSSRASHAIREGSVNSMKVDYHKVRVIKMIEKRIVEYLENHNGKASVRELMRNLSISRQELDECLTLMPDIEVKIVPRHGKGRDVRYISLSGEPVSVPDDVAEKARINRQILLSAKSLVAAAIQARKARLRATS